MASNYKRIRSDNERRYGTDIGRIGPMLLADRYADRTHFIFEILQNAEDALARRDGWTGSRSVRFELSNTELRIVHCGKPFDDDDVRGVCGIAESTKDLTSIGRFGIGFKSVYSITLRPEIHSGREAFAIETFVWPTAVPGVARKADETVIVLPLSDDGGKTWREIADGLKRLNPSTLLFLRQIDGIEWRVDGGAHGTCLRGDAAPTSSGMRRVHLLGERNDKAVSDETWAVFSDKANAKDGRLAGYVEVAFRLGDKANGVQPLSMSPLVVFFPTVVQTHLGFLVQGPYRTTPSRDNVPADDPWNKELVKKTGKLLVAALGQLRDERLLDTTALRSLPIEKSKFGLDNMFAPLFTDVRAALNGSALLPRNDAGHCTAKQARLARTQELRDLLEPTQLGGLFGVSTGLAWLSGEISQDRTPELRKYLMEELGIVEVTPEMLVSRLTAGLLESQPDEWIRRLYEFLNGQQALVRSGKLKTVPLVRLKDGTHVVPEANGKLQAFLPGNTVTDFPTVRPEACGSDAARMFLTALGLTEPDPVHDVIHNVLPKYQGENVELEDDQYVRDIARILKAFAVDSTARKASLVEELRKSWFLRVVDVGDGERWFVKPGDAYLASQRHRDLFTGVAEVYLVDDRYTCLTGKEIGDVFEACGVARSLMLEKTDPELSPQRRRELRRAAGCVNCSGNEVTEDVIIWGLEGLLELLPTLPVEERKSRTRRLWEALGDLRERRGESAFSATYRWFYREAWSTTLPATFVGQLNDTAWVPDEHGELVPPSQILFDGLGWKPNPFLQSKIAFKAPVIDELAKEAGIDPDLLALVKKKGVTTEQLLAWLADEPSAEDGEGEQEGVETEDEDEDADETMSPQDAVIALLGGQNRPTPLPEDAIDPDPVQPNKPGRRDAKDTSTGPDGGTQGNNDGGSGGNRGGGHQTTKQPSNKRSSSSGKGDRTFFSYVAVHPADDDEDDEGDDDDGLDHAARMALEQAATDLIVSEEPGLQPMPKGNHGFDLAELADDGTPILWVEVKAMKGSLRERPVGMSKTQFECASQHGPKYWLYVVEHAGHADKARIVRIQDPAGQARKFTFDKGWLAVAVADGEHDDEQETADGED